MNRNTILGLLLIFGIFIGWSYWMSPSEEELEQQQQEQMVEKRKRQVSDSIAEVARIQQQLLMEQQAAERIEVEVNVEDTASDYNRLRNTYGGFALSGEGKDEFITIENDLMKMLVSIRGGRIFSVELKNYQTYDSLPLILFNSDSAKFGYNFYSQGVHLNTSDLYFQSLLPETHIIGDKSVRVSGDDSTQVVFRLFADASADALNPEKYFEYVYTIYGDQYMLDYTLRLKGLGTDITSRIPSILELDWVTFLRRQEKTQDRMSGTTIYFRANDNEVDYLSESDEDEMSFNDKLQWVSLKQRFFTSSLIIDKEHFDNPQLAHSTAENPYSARYLKTMIVKVDVPVSGFNDSRTDFRFYFGPNDYNIMRSYKLDLERQIPLGWSFFLLQWINRFAIIPVFTGWEATDGTMVS
ncbi:MAG: membrane protein insertase YidC [Bacteroidetes bacterium]|nr:membrane protein insertase YidC [Bacteroidota bacterium]